MRRFSPSFDGTMIAFCFVLLLPIFFAGKVSSNDSEQKLDIVPAENLPTAKRLAEQALEQYSISSKRSTTLVELTKAQYEPMPNGHRYILMMKAAQPSGTVSCDYELEAEGIPENLVFSRGQCNPIGTEPEAKSDLDEVYLEGLGNVKLPHKKHRPPDERQKRPMTDDPNGSLEFFDDYGIVENPT